MTEKEVNGHKVVFFDSPEQMTIRRYHRFNKFLMIENEVGSNFADFDSKLRKALQFFKKGMQSEAMDSLKNWRQLVYNAFMEYSPQNMALALIVKSIDGTEYKDITGGGLQKVLDELENIGFTQGMSNTTVADIKKKIDTELRLYFPSEFKRDTETKEYNNNLKKLLVLEFGKLAGDKVDEDDIDKIERELLRLSTPNVWNIHTAGNMEIQMESDFEKLLLAVGEHTREKIDEITVFRFYSLLGYIKEKNKPKTA